MKRKKHHAKVDEIAEDVLAGRAPLLVVVSGVAAMNGWRHRQLADAIGMHEQGICGVLKGRTPGGVDEQRLRDYLGYPAKGRPPHRGRAATFARGLKARRLRLEVAVMAFCRANEIWESDLGALVGRHPNSWVASKRAAALGDERAQPTDARCPGTRADVARLIGWEVSP